MPTFSCSVSEQASTTILRLVGGGFSAGAMSSGPFSGLGDELMVVSGDVISARAVFAVFTPESVSVLDSFVTQAEYIIPVDEDAVGSDALINNIDVLMAFADAAAQADLIVGRAAFSSSVIETAKTTVTREVAGGFSTGSISSGPFSGLGGLDDMTREVPSDIISAQPIYSVSFTDASSVAEAISALATVNGKVEERVTVRGIAAANATISVAVVNSASYTDLVSSSVVFQTNVVTTAHTLDQISVRLLWEPITPAPPTVWTIINTLP